MAKARKYGNDGKQNGTADLPAAIFEAPVNEHLIWEAVKSHLGNQRQGTAVAKNRALVSGGGRKPWKQKGTGRARSGSNTSPLWPGGGVAFGPKQRDHRTELPKGQRRQALASALSLKASENAVAVLESLAFAEPKTSEMAKVLD